MTNVAKIRSSLTYLYLPMGKDDYIYLGENDYICLGKSLKFISL